MPKFNLYYGIEQEQFNLRVEEGVQLPSLHHAKVEAKELAEDLYMQDPVRDVWDIVKEEKVKDEEANRLFAIDMFQKTAYHVEELVEINGELIEVIRHEYK